MKLVLAENRAGKLLSERAFTSDVVLVGRDPSVCHYFFSQEQWPMVSRKHAEFRFVDGRCVVADANSRFGTFVNGQRINTPVQVRVGSNIQLGAEGPILRVVGLEDAPAQNAEPPSREMGRMATIRDAVSSNAASGRDAAADAKGAGFTPNRITPTPSAPATASSARL